MTYADDVCNAKKSQGEPKRMAQNITKLKSNKKRSAQMIKSYFSKSENLENA